MTLIETVLTQSINHNKNVIIVYDGKNGISQRKIKPKQLNGDNLLAYCYMKNNMRKFRIDHILSAVIQED